MNIALKQVEIARSPRVTTIELPYPPSVNHIWKYQRGGKVKRSAPYEKWIRAADNIALQFCQLRGVQMITGHFTAEITLSFSRRASNSDCDNRIKPLLDWAVSRRLVVDDSYCDRVVCEWGFAKHGCVLALKEVSA